MAFGDADLPTFFQDFGEDIVFNSVTVKGLIDDEDARENGAANGLDVVGEVMCITVPYNAWSPMPTRKSAITVAGVNKVVRDTLLSKNQTVFLYVVDP